MERKFWFFVIILIVIFLALLLLIFINYKTDKEQTNEQTSLPNPAAIYCVEQGYKYEIKTNPDGSQYGVCVFPDGSECKGWAFYRGECKIGESKLNSSMIGTPNPSAIYCEKLGYTYKIDKTSKGEEGTCIVKQGVKFKAWDFFKGKVGKEHSYCAKKDYDIETEKKDFEKYSTEYAVCVQPGKRISMEELMEQEGEPLIDTESYTIGKDVKDKQIIEKESLGLLQEVNLQKNSIELGSLGTPPSSFDWRDYNGEDWITSVKDQAQCGSCWAFSAVGAVESKFNIDNNNASLDYDLSEQHLVSCDCPGDCNGGWSDVALGYIRDTGVADEDCFGYLGCANWNPGKGECTQEYPCNLCEDWQDRAAYITNYHYVTNTQEDYKQALVDYGPLSIALDATGWSSYTGGIFVGSTSQANHAVVLVGYNDAESYWIVKNSWASDWGENGYIRLSYTNNPITTFDEVYAVEQTLKPIIRGTLQPYIINIPSEVTKDEFFSAGTGVQCIGGSCGDVSATLTLPPTQPTTCSEIWGFDCGANPDLDNTFDICSNTAGNDEHIEEIYLDKSKLNSFEEEIEVKCEVMIDSIMANPSYGCGYGYTGDNLYIYYRNNPSGNWRILGYASQVYSCYSYSIKFVPDNVEGEHQVRCITGYQLSESECGSGSAYDNDDANFFVYNHTSGKGKVPIDYGSPFYTTSDNPQLCPNMQDQDTCEQIWTTKATGDIDSSWLLYTIYDSNYKVIETKETARVNVTIVEGGEFISITLYDYLIDFSNQDPNTYNNPGTENPYTIRVDDTTTVNVDIYQKGDDFNYNGEILRISNMSWLNTNNTVSSYQMLNNYQNNITNIFPDTNISSYYWLDIPLAQYAGNYETTIYIKAVETGTSP